jgi:hypothetical protein
MGRRRNFVPESALSLSGLRGKALRYSLADPRDRLAAGRVDGLLFEFLADDGVRDEITHRAAKGEPLPEPAVRATRDLDFSA